MKRIEKIAAILFIATLSGNSCKIVQPKISLQGGINAGGITENTDLNVISNVKSGTGEIADAYSGATNLGYNIGVHVNIPVLSNETETGIDYMYNHQKFTYNDQGNNYMGNRNISISQIMVPLTYNFKLFKNSFESGDVQLKIGLIGQLNLFSVDNSGVLPDYNLKNFSGGPIFGFSFYPVVFNNGAKLGLYFDAYRGSRVYEDFYNQKTFDMPATSFMKAGIRYKF